MPKVGIVMGSDSDMPVILPTVLFLHFLTVFKPDTNAKTPMQIHPILKIMSIAFIKSPLFLL